MAACCETAHGEEVFWLWILLHAEASAAGKPTGPVEEILQEVRLELAAVRSGNGPR